jgi:TIR domain
MAQCTAPVQGHRSAAARANCPACGGRGGYSTYYSPQPYYTPTPLANRSAGYTSSGSSGGSRSSGSSTRPRWSPSSSPVTYTEEQRRVLTPVREQVEQRATEPELHDLFLCHAWDDRRTTATYLCDLLKTNGASVWFSEKDIVLGTSWLREIDKGLAKSRIGLVLVTPSFLKRVEAGGVSDKELSELLHRGQLIPVLHGTTFEELRRVSPLLASRNGLNTEEDSMETIAIKIAELVKIN